MNNIAGRITDLGVSGAGVGVGVERLGLAISSPMKNITKTLALLRMCSNKLLSQKICIYTNGVKHVEAHREGRGKFISIDVNVLPKIEP